MNRDAIDVDHNSSDGDAVFHTSVSAAYAGSAVKG